MNVDWFFKRAIPLTTTLQCHRRSDGDISRHSVASTVAIPAAFWEASSHLGTASSREPGSLGGSARNHNRRDSSVPPVWGGSALDGTVEVQAAHSPGLGTYPSTGRGVPSVGGSTGGSAQFDPGASSPAVATANSRGSSRRLLRKGNARAAVSARWGALAGADTRRSVSPTEDGSGGSDDAGTGRSLHVPVPPFGVGDHASFVSIVDCSSSSAVAGSAAVGPASNNGDRVDRGGRRDLL